MESDDVEISNMIFMSDHYIQEFRSSNRYQVQNEKELIKFIKIKDQ